MRRLKEIQCNLKVIVLQFLLSVVWTLLAPLCLALQSPNDIHRNYHVPSFMNIYNNHTSNTSSNERDTLQ